MPVTVVNTSTRIRARVVDSIDSDGNERLATRTFNNVRPNIDNGTLYNVALQMLSLQKKPVNSLIKITEEELRQ